MKKVMLFLMLIFSSVVFSQSACRCEGMFGSCVIRCGENETASCGETWYGGCSCKCNEKVITKPELEANLYKIDLKKVKIFKDFLFRINSPDATNIESLIAKMDKKSKNSIFKTKNYSEHVMYFSKLKEYFDKLAFEKQKELYEKIKIS